MSELSKNELIYENSVSFPNNNSGEISPADLRNFHVSLIDSTVNQTQYTNDSGSFDDRLDSVEESVVNLNSYTASTDIRLDDLETDVDQLLIASTSFEAKFDEIAIQSASWGGYSTASFATTGSNTFTGGQTIVSNDGLVLQNNGGSGDVVITPGPDYITKFTDSELLGIYVIGTSKISGSWGGVGASPGGIGSGGVVGIYNNQTASLARTVIRTAFEGSPAPNSQRENGYDALAITPSTSTEESQFAIKGTQVTISATSASKQTSVTVSGDITASNISLSNDLIVSGTIRAYEIVTTIESSSVIFSSGSNILGDDISDTQTIVGQTSISGGAEISGSVAIQGNQTVNGVTNQNGNLIQGILTGTNAAEFRQNPNYYSDYYGSLLSWRPNIGGGQTLISLSEKTTVSLLLNAWSGAYDNATGLRSSEVGAEFYDWQLPSYTETSWLIVPQQGTPAFQRGLDITGSVSIEGNQTINGSSTQNIPAPAQNVETPFVNVTLFVVVIFLNFSTILLSFLFSNILILFSQLFTILSLFSS
jgi:hypothetical protein